MRIFKIKTRRIFLALAFISAVAAVCILMFTVFKLNGFFSAERIDKGFDSENKESAWKYIIDLDNMADSHFEKNNDNISNTLTILCGAQNSYDFSFLKKIDFTDIETMELIGKKSDISPSRSFCVLPQVFVNMPLNPKKYEALLVIIENMVITEQSAEQFVNVGLNGNNAYVINLALISCQLQGNIISTLHEYNFCGTITAFDIIDGEDDLEWINKYLDSTRNNVNGKDSAGYFEIGDFDVVRSSEDN